MHIITCSRIHYTYIAVKIKKHGQTSAKNNRISLLCTVIFVYQLDDLFVI